MNDPRLRYHDLGFLEVVDSPTSEELKAYYEHLYYQTEQGNYRKAYSEEELDFLELKIAQKASLVTSLRGNDTPGSFLDVGCVKVSPWHGFVSRGGPLRVSTIVQSGSKL